MRLFACSASLLFASALTAFGQNYQPQGGNTPQPSYQAPQSNYQQYPSDPYSGKPQPTQSSYQSTSTGGSAGATPILSYNFLDAKYNFNTFSNITNLSNGSGVGANLNVALFKPLFLHFGVNWLNTTDASGSNSFSMGSFSGGAGAFLPISDRFHVFGEIGMRYDSVSGVTSTISKNDFAVYLRPGVRFAATDKLELEGEMTFNSTDNLNNRIYTIQAYYAALSVLDIGLGMDFSSDVNSYHAGLRLRW